MKLISFNVRKPLPDENLDDLHSFDNTKLSAVNTCPVWGIVRYGHHKVFSSNLNYRAMALEAGSACHEVFAGARIFDAIEYGTKIYQDKYDPRDIKREAEGRAIEMFGIDRARGMFAEFDSTEDIRTRILRAGLYILQTGAFYDDPSDKRRTVSNLEEALIAYLDRYEFGRNVPYYQPGYIGIETTVNLIVEYTVQDTEGTISTRKVRFTGKIDGVHIHKNDLVKPYIEENKTASRLGEAWEQSFELSHQVTGYIIATRTILETNDVDMARIYGVCIPQPRLYSDGLSTITVWRRPHQFTEWAKWFVHTVEMYLRWINDPLDAPKYTHSCNRYFRPCSYIPLCAAEPEERQEIYNEMVEDEWSPLQEKAGD